MPEGSLTFHDVCYEASVRCGRGRKIILDSCSGVMRSGVNAIMGPTGSGKTTLLDIMADRRGSKGIAGTVLVNGNRRPKNFKCVSGYVVQDDLMMGVLTVRENLQFSAALRLPSHMTHRQRMERVERIIEQLGLQSCADTKVGTELLRGVSGGERKRTAVGMELIIEPQVLFLDEPTTGLDAHTAVSVMELLLQLSHTSNTIVVLSIHQPRYSIFKLFNSLTLLSRGKVVFHGPAEEALPYFDSIGVKCPEHENPADFFLDVILLNGVEDMAVKATMGSTDDSGEVQVVHVDEQTTLHFKAKKTSTTHLAGARALDLVEHYQQSELNRATDKQLRSVIVELQEKERTRQERMTKTANYATTFFWQLLIVAFRALVSTLKNPLAFAFLLINLTILALIAGFVYLQLGKKTPSESNLSNVINDRLGAFFFIVINLVFSNLSAVELFIKQKALFIHENASGYYRVTVFFLAQVLSDLIPKRIIPVCFYAVIVYFMIGFQTDASKFFIFLLTLFLISTVATTVTYAFGSMFNTTAIVNLFSAMIFVLSMLFGGFFIALDSLPVWLQWLKYLSPFRYSMEALAINEIAGKLYYANSTYPDSSGESPSCQLPTCLNGTEDLMARGFQTSSVWIWYDQIALLAMSLFFLTICFINLQVTKKYK